MDKMIISPADIESESMKIIENELKRRGFFNTSKPSGLELAIIKRVIHATADFDFAENLRFTEAFSGLFSDADDDFDKNNQCGVCQKSDGQDQPLPVSEGTIITVTNMILAGLNRPAMKKLALDAVCYMNDPEIAREAKERGVTRAVVSIGHAVNLFPDGIYLIGNAPTALLRLSELIKEGKAFPKLVVGVPVGFVNVLESKEMAMSVCKEYSIPAVFSIGRKGGSTVAVAIMNAIMYRFLNVFRRSETTQD